MTGGTDFAGTVTVKAIDGAIESNPWGVQVVRPSTPDFCSMWLEELLNGGRVVRIRLPWLHGFSWSV